MEEHQILACYLQYTNRPFLKKTLIYSNTELVSCRISKRALPKSSEHQKLNHGSGPEDKPGCWSYGATPGTRCCVPPQALGRARLYPHPSFRKRTQPHNQAALLRPGTSGTAPGSISPSRRGWEWQRPGSRADICEGHPAEQRRAAKHGRAASGARFGGETGRHGALLPSASAAAGLRGSAAPRPAPLPLTAGLRGSQRSTGGASRGAEGPARPPPPPPPSGARPGKRRRGGGGPRSAAGAYLRRGPGPEGSRGRGRAGPVGAAPALARRRSELRPGRAAERRAAPGERRRGAAARPEQPKAERRRQPAPAERRAPASAAAATLPPLQPARQPGTGSGAPSGTGMERPQPPRIAPGPSPPPGVWGCARCPPQCRVL